MADDEDYDGGDMDDQDYVDDDDMLEEDVDNEAQEDDGFALVQVCFFTCAES